MTGGTLKITGALNSCRGQHNTNKEKEEMKKLIIIGALLLGLALPGLAQDIISPGMSGVQTRNALNTAFSELLGVVDTVNETVRIGGIQITANAAEVNILDGGLVNVTELNRLVGLPDNIVTLLNAKENSLGNPGTTGYVLSSTTAGVRSWIAPGGGAVYPEGTGIPFVNAGTSWGTTVSTVSQTELGYIDGLDGTAASRQNVRDSLLNALAGAEEVIAQKDSTGNAVGNYMTRKGVTDAIAAAGGSGGNAFLVELDALGMDVVALPIGASAPMTMNKTLIDGTAYWQSFYLPEAVTMTGVKWLHRTAGVYTPDEFNGFALYTVSGTTYTKVRESSNTGTFWSAAGYALGTAAFTSTYSAAAGIYMVAFVYNSSAQTTAPSIYCWNGSNGISQVMTGGHKITGDVTGQTTLPTTETAADIAAGDVVFGIWLY